MGCLFVFFRMYNKNICVYVKYYHSNDVISISSSFLSMTNGVTGCKIHIIGVLLDIFCIYIKKKQDLMIFLTFHFLFNPSE